METQEVVGQQQDDVEDRPDGTQSQQSLKDQAETPVSRHSTPRQASEDDEPTDEQQDAVNDVSSQRLWQHLRSDSH